MITELARRERIIAQQRGKIRGNLVGALIAGMESILTCAGMDQETFRKMWDLSDADETRHLFMRITQTDYYVTEKADENQSMYPAVRSLVYIEQTTNQ